MRRSTAACSEEGRRAIAAWTRARHLLADPEAKQRLLGSLLERHHADRVIVFVGDNETAYRVAREYLVMGLTCDIGRSVNDRIRVPNVLVSPAVHLAKKGKPEQDHLPWASSSSIAKPTAAVRRLAP
jgi:hypothetical protein